MESDLRASNPIPFLKFNLLACFRLPWCACFVAVCILFACVQLFPCCLFQTVMVFVDLLTQVWERPSKYFHLAASMVISHPMWVLPFSCSILNSLLWTLPYRPSSLGSFITFFLFLSDVEATYLSLFQTACIVLRRICILNCSYRSVVHRSAWLIARGHHAYIHTRRHE